jgi:hypothetical protein
MENEHKFQRSFYDRKLVELIQQHKSIKNIFKSIFLALSRMPNVFTFGKTINCPLGFFVQYERYQVIDLPAILISDEYAVIHTHYDTNTDHYYYKIDLKSN